LIRDLRHRRDHLPRGGAWIRGASFRRFHRKGCRARHAQPDQAYRSGGDGDRSACTVAVVETRGRRRFRALRPVSPEDSRLFQALLDGKFLIQGIRNKDLRQLLFPATANPLQERKQAGRITRWLTLLKSHNLIYRVAKTNYYRLTKLGNEIMTTATKFRETNIALLAA